VRIDIKNNIKLHWCIEERKNYNYFSFIYSTYNFFDVILLREVCSVFITNLKHVALTFVDCLHFKENYFCNRMMTTTTTTTTRTTKTTTMETETAKRGRTDRRRRKSDFGIEKLSITKIGSGPTRHRTRSSDTLQPTNRRSMLR
jgi:hypothetical protein